MTNKPIIYQVFPRLFTNYKENCRPNGTLRQNGVGKLNRITRPVLDAIKELGVTDIWYTGVIEHAQSTDYSKYGIRVDNPNVVKGKAGSPYAIKDYYDIDPDLAEDVTSRMQEFEALVARTHDAGMGVIIDFVPNHVARQYYSDSRPEGVRDLGEDDNKDMAFSRDNNFYYIPGCEFSPAIPLGNGRQAYHEYPVRATGNDCFSPSPGAFDWYETVKLNYGIDYCGGGGRYFDPIPDTWIKMLAILQFWASKGIDGFRCDMAHMVPVEFWEWAISNVKSQYPHIKFIAELYEPAIYRDYIFRGGFDYLYDKVNLYDTLRGIETMGWPASNITGCWQTVDGISRHMLNFLENHDEQRFASRFYAGDPMRVIPSLVVSSMISDGPMMIYAGQELGESAPDAEGYSGDDGRTTIFDYWNVDTVRRWLNKGYPSNKMLTAQEQHLRAIYSKILTLCNEEQAVSRGGFFDLMYVNYENPSLDPTRQYVFLRHHAHETLLIAVNFAHTACDLRVNIPPHAFEHFDLTEGEVNATELLTGRIEAKQFATDATFDTHVEAGGAVVWKFTH